MKAETFSHQLPDGLHLRGLRWNANAPCKVLAVHGWLDNAHSFLPMADYLPDHIDLIAIDLAGHGLSDHRTTDSWYFMVDFVRDLNTLIDQLGWSSLALLGHSLGGGISCLLTAACTQPIKALALIEGLGPLSGEPQQSAANLKRALTGLQQAKQTQLRRHENQQSAIKARLMSNNMHVTSAEVLIQRGLQPVDDGWIWRTDPRLRVASPMRYTEAEILYILDAIECPVLQVLPDPASPLMKLARMQRRKATLSQYTEVLIPGHHHVHMDAPEACAESIFPFLSHHLEPPL